MSGKKRTDWQWEQRQRELADQRRRERLEEEARAQERARQVEIRRALEESLRRSVGERRSQLLPTAAQAIELLSRVEHGIDPVTSRAYSDEIAGVLERRNQLASLAQEVARLGKLSGGALVDQKVDPNGTPFSDLEQALGDVSAMAARLEELRYHEGPQRQRELAARIGAVESLSASATAFSGGEELNRSMVKEIAGAHQLLARGEFADVEHAVDSMRASVSQWLSSASSQREHRLERRAVLDALRDSCRSVGFEEMNTRQLEAAVKDPDGRWSLVVRHPLRGEIVFMIDDASILAETAIGVAGDQVIGEHCFSEFRVIEEELAEHHGLHTRFVSDTVDRTIPPARSKQRPSQSAASQAKRKS